MTSHKSSINKNPNISNNTISQNDYINNAKQSNQIQWVAVYLDSKFYLTNPIAYKRLQNLDQQIQQQKNRLNKLQKTSQQQQQPQKIQIQIQKQKLKQTNGQIQQKQINNKIRKNSIDSAMSRQCRTQINQLKALKAKIQAQKQLAEQQLKYQNKTIQVKKRRSLKDTTFVIRNPNTSIDKIQQNKKKSSIKNFMMGPLQLSGRQQNIQEKQKSRVSESRQSQQFSQFRQQRVSNRYQTIQPKTSKNGDKNNKQGGDTIKISLNSQQKFYQQQYNSKSKQKSFIITSRKASSSASNQKRQSFISGSALKQKQSQSNKQKVNSQKQIQLLNIKLKKMQQKLTLVQSKQKQLEQFQKQKQSQAASYKSRQNSRISSKINRSIKSNKQPEQQYIHKNSQNNKSQQNFTQKQIKIQQQQSKQQHNIQKPTKQSKVQKIQKLPQKSQKQIKKFYKQQKIKKLGITNQLVTYNYNQDQQKIKKIQQQLHIKQKMGDEINQLKKMIKQLKIQKIKQQTIIQQLSQQKQKQLKKSNNYIQSNNSQVTFNGTQSKAISSIHSHLHQNQNEQIDFSFKPNILQQGKQQKILSQISSDKQKPLIKKQPRRFLKIQSNQKNKNQKIIYTAQKINNKKQIFSLNSQEIRNNYQNQYQKQQQNQIFYNPEISNNNNNKQRLNSSVLSKRGVIIKQIINKNKFNTLDVKNSQQSIISQNKKNSQDNNHNKQSKKLQDYISQEDLKQFQKPLITIPEIQILQGFPIPDLPLTPLAETSQSEVLALAKKICELFEIKINGKQQLQYKKFKNCVVLKSTQDNKAIVWHFSGKFYIGGWNQNNSTGQDHKQGDGFQYVPSKHYYRGQFKNNKRHGLGTMITLDKNIYKGEWCNGQKNGQGISYQKNINAYYQGQFKNGKKQGHGILKLSQKQFYQGQFQKFIKSGQGTQLFSNGDIYIGSYKNGKFNGKGKYYWSNGSTYVGNFIQGQRQGFGKWRSSQIDGDIYIGEYKKDKKSGKGKYIWANGCKFQGNFIADLKNGEGQVIYQDGRQVKGIWQYGKLKQIIKSENTIGNQQSFHSLQIQPRIRPNIPKIVQSPSRKMQQSKVIQGV